MHRTQTVNREKYFLCFDAALCSFPVHNARFQGKFYLPLRSAARIRKNLSKLYVRRRIQVAFEILNFCNTSRGILEGCPAVGKRRHFFLFLFTLLSARFGVNAVGSSYGHPRFGHPKLETGSPRALLVEHPCHWKTASLRWLKLVYGFPSLEPKTRCGKDQSLK